MFARKQAIYNTEKLRIVMMPTLLSLVTPDIVATTTCCAISDDKVCITTTLDFRCMWVRKLFVWIHAACVCMNNSYYIMSKRPNSKWQPSKQFVWYTSNKLKVAIRLTIWHPYRKPCNNCWRGIPYIVAGIIGRVPKPWLSRLVEWRVVSQRWLGLAHCSIESNMRLRYVIAHFIHNEYSHKSSLWLLMPWWWCHQMGTKPLTTSKLPPSVTTSMMTCHWAYPALQKLTHLPLEDVAVILKIVFQNHYTE